jgi:hypothetical protein
MAREPLTKTWLVKDSRNVTLNVADVRYRDKLTGDVSRNIAITLHESHTGI